MFLALLYLAGCQSTANPAMEMVRAVFFEAQPTGAGLDPRIAYLRVTSRQRVAFLALGYVDPHPQGAIEVWYSAERETLRLQNGRVLGISGTLTEWLQVHLPVLPSWTELLARDSAFRWARMRDVMPGYHFNLRDDLHLRSIAVPAKSALVGVDAASLRWFEETSMSTGAESLPPARYAVQAVQSEAVVVYGEQCISIDFCITWQRWKPLP